MVRLYTRQTRTTGENIFAYGMRECYKPWKKLKLTDKKNLGDEILVN